MTQADAERFSEGINNTVQSVVPRLKDFHQLLLLPPKVSWSWFCVCYIFRLLPQLVPVLIS